MWISSTRKIFKLEVWAPPCYILRVFEIALPLILLIVVPLFALFHFLYLVLSPWTVTTEMVANDEVSQEWFHSTCHHFMFYFFPLFLIIGVKKWLNAHTVPLLLTHESAFIFISEHFQGRNGKQALAASSGILLGAQSEHLTSSLMFVSSLTCTRTHTHTHTHSQSILTLLNTGAI